MKFKVSVSYGFAGTDSQEVVSAKQFLGLSDEDFECLTKKDVEEMIYDECWRAAVERVDVGVVEIQEE